MNREGTLLITRAVRWRWVLWRTAALVGLTLAACTQPDSEPSPSPLSADNSCVDHDGDGFGERCPAGGDCNDKDKSVHENCVHCAEPEQGCPCKEGDEPVACWLDRTAGDAGVIMCHEGTRSCRDQRWSACESVREYPAPNAPAGTTALVDPDSPPDHCDPCKVNCYKVTDQLDPADGGLNSDNSMGVDWVPGGGLTLGVVPGSDAGTPPPDTTPKPPCEPNSGVGDDKDCDGIPDMFDPYPDKPPFATANPTIFMNIAPGQTGVGQIDLNFKVNSADVYFLVDQSGSMDQERDQLKASLTTGDFIKDDNYHCADFDFDHAPNDELKGQGIIGAIRCMIRDANFGVGFFREIPFSGYAATDHIAFANYHDISSDIPSVLTAVNRLTTVGNSDWPEASMVALHQVLTGDGMYFGTTRRGIPKRETCGPLTWGYPCFRTGAVPIVVMFTDAQFHNGPLSGGTALGYNYSSPFSITAGTGTPPKYIPVVSTGATRNDTFATAADLGDVTSTYQTYWGTTESMADDVNSPYFACMSETGGKDAVFKFSLTQQKTVRIESTGSQFDSLLALYTGIPGPATALPASPNTNEIGSSAHSLGTVGGNASVITGSTAAMTADYQWSEVGCSASTTSPDAVFKFDVTAANTQVTLDTVGSSFDTVLGLYAAEPRVAPTYTAVTGNEDHTSAYGVPSINSQLRAYSGNTSAMASDYNANQIGCGVDNAAPDATFGFTLDSTRTVRISTEGSSFDTVLGLYSGAANPVGTATVPATNEDYGSAYDVGTIDGKIMKLTGSTSGMDANYFANQVNCNANTFASDAVFKFHVNSTRDVQIDTIGTSGWDSVLALYSQAPDATTQVTVTNNNEAYASAYNLGTINSKDVIINGGDTTGMAADFNSSVSSNPCSTSSSGVTAPDAAYRFKVTSATTVKIDTTGTSAFDSTIAVHSIAPVEASTPQAATNDTVATAANVGNILNSSFQRTGDTSSLAHNYNFTGAHTSARDAVYQFSVPSTRTVQIDTSGSTFDTAIALYGAFIPNLATSATTTSSTQANSSGSPYDAGTMDDKWRVLTGDTSSATKDWSDNHCSTDTDSPDVYYKFTLDTPRTMTIGISSSWGNVGSARAILYAGALNSGSYYDCVTRNSSSDFSLSAGTYYVVVKGNNGSNAKGSYSLTLRDITSSTLITTNDDVSAGSDNTSLISRSLTAGTYTVVVSAHSDVYGSYTVRFRDKTYWDSFGYITCNNGSGNASTIEQIFQPGDYGVVVKGRTRYDDGPYALRITDTTSPPAAPGVLTCDDDSGGSNTAKIVRNLAAGDYWIIMKGDASSDAGSYTLNIKDAGATSSGTLVQCDDNSGDSPSSVIERTLLAGQYQVILKGKAAADKGAYKITVRDVGNVPITRLGCDNDSGGSGASRLSATLGIGTYYAVLKGRTPSAKGDFSLTLRDSYNKPTTSYSCDDDGSTYNTSKLTATLNAGTYYAVLKGFNASAVGPYQLSIGAASTTTSSYTPPSWTTTLAKVKSTGARVISILSCKDDPDHGDALSNDCKEARYQAQTLATESNALGPTNNKLVFDITRDGSGLSNTVVTAIAQLSNYLSMNVKARVVFSPDADPGFLVTVRAVNDVSDGCDGLAGSEHQNCRPGATPRFLIDFVNPLSKPVPLNPKDTKGGYNFRAELIGNDQFIVDQIPIYIIPQAPPIPAEPPPDYYENGEYRQDITASTCDVTERPDWTDLRWSASIYANTSVTFSMCTADKQEDLSKCTKHQVVKVTGTTKCTVDSECKPGYCDATIGVCQVVTGGACEDDAGCASNADCNATSKKCTYTSQPALIGPELDADNLKPYMRMTVALSGVEPIVQAPIVRWWEAQYECRGVQ